MAAIPQFNLNHARPLPQEKANVLSSRRAWGFALTVFGAGGIALTNRFYNLTGTPTFSLHTYNGVWWASRAFTGVGVLTFGLNNYWAKDYHRNPVAKERFEGLVNADLAKIQEEYDNDAWHYLGTDDFKDLLRPKLRSNGIDQLTDEIYTEIWGDRKTFVTAHATYHLERFKKNEINCAQYKSLVNDIGIEKLMAYLQEEAKTLTLEEFVNRYGYEAFSCIEDQTVLDDAKDRYAIENIEKSFAELVQSEREALGIKTTEAWKKLTDDHAELKIEKELMTWADFRELKGDTAWADCSKNEACRQAVIDWLITLSYSELIETPEYKAQIDGFEVGVYLTTAAEKMTSLEFLKKHGWSDEIAKFVKSDAKDKLVAKAEKRIKANGVPELDKVACYTALVGQENLKEWVLHYYKSVEALVLDEAKIVAAGLTVREVLDGRWKDLDVLKIVDKGDGAILCNAVDDGTYEATDWYDKDLINTQKPSIFDLFEKHPKLFSLGILKSADCKDHLTAELAATTDSQLAGAFCLEIKDLEPEKQYNGMKKLIDEAEITLQAVLNKRWAEKTYAEIANASKPLFIAALQQEAYQPEEWRDRAKTATDNIVTATILAKYYPEVIELGILERDDVKDRLVTELEKCQSLMEVKTQHPLYVKHDFINAEWPVMQQLAANFYLEDLSRAHNANGETAKLVCGEVSSLRNNLRQALEKAEKQFAEDVKGAEELAEKTKAEAAAAESALEENIEKWNEERETGTGKLEEILSTAKDALEKLEEEHKRQSAKCSQLEDVAANLTQLMKQKEELEGTIAKLKDAPSELDKYQKLSNANATAEIDLLVDDLDSPTSNPSSPHSNENLDLYEEEIAEWTEKCKKLETASDQLKAIEGQIEEARKTEEKAKELRLKVEESATQIASQQQKVEVATKQLTEYKNETDTQDKKRDEELKAATAALGEVDEILKKCKQKKVEAEETKNKAMQEANEQFKAELKKLVEKEKAA